MNKPSRPEPPFATASPPYELDGYGWAMAQAELLRARRFEDIDLENVIEEIESVGRSEQSRGESALRVLMMHILKWQHQPERRGRSWALSIASQRVAFEQVMKKNSGLKPHLDEMRDEAFRRARIEAARELDVPLRTLPADPPDWHVIVDEPFEHDPA